jgi:hypothetical protein
MLHLPGARTNIDPSIVAAQWYTHECLATSSEELGLKEPASWKRWRWRSSWSSTDPEATLQLEWALQMIRSSFDECDFTESCSQEEAVRIVANQCWGFVVGARGLSGLVWTGHIADATETSSSEALQAKSAAPVVAIEKCEEEEAWGAATGGDAGGHKLAAKGRGVQHRQGDKLAGTDAGKRVVSVVAGGGRRGPSAGGDRPAARNPLRSGDRAGRLGRLAAWGPTPALSARVAFRALHLTGSGRLWVPRSRLLLLRSGGQVGRRGRRI